MVHMREQILQAAAAAVTGLPTTGNNVFVGRVTPLERGEVPGLKLRLGPERIEVNNFDPPRVQERFLQLDVAIAVQEVDGLETDTNQVLLEVEAALAMPAALAAVNIKAITLAFIERPRQVMNEKPVAETVASFEVRYATLENAPDVAH